MALSRTRDSFTRGHPGFIKLPFPVFPSERVVAAVSKIINGTESQGRLKKPLTGQGYEAFKKKKKKKQSTRNANEANARACSTRVETQPQSPRGLAGQAHPGPVKAFVAGSV